MVDLGEPIRDLRVLEEKQFDFGRKNTETGFSCLKNGNKKMPLRVRRDMRRGNGWTQRRS